MKKLLLTVVAVTTALFLMSCDQPNSDSKNENEYDDYNKPSLPETVGEDPFKGNTYASDYNKWVFSDDGKITQYAKHNDSDFVAEAELEYSYNEDTGLLTARVNKIKKTNSSEEYVLMTYDEALAQETRIPAFEEEFPIEKWEEVLEMLKNYEGWAGILGVSESASDETILRAYYNHKIQMKMQGIDKTVKSLKEDFEKLYTYKAWGSVHRAQFITYYPENESLKTIHFDGTTGNIFVSIFHGDQLHIQDIGEHKWYYFGITEFTDSQIKGKELIGDTTITLSYTKSWNEGAFTLKVRAVDDATKALIGEDEIELKSSNEMYLFY